jgi:hypothetical protein
MIFCLLRLLAVAARSAGLTSVVPLSLSNSSGHGKAVCKEDNICGEPRYEGVELLNARVDILIGSGGGTDKVVPVWTVFPGVLAVQTMVTDAAGIVFVFVAAFVALISAHVARGFQP